MSQKRWVLGAVGAGLLVVGMVAGVLIGNSLQASASSYTALAATPGSASGYCQLYESTLAGKLGKSTTDLESANQAALQAVLDQMVKDGKITAAQETQLEAKLQKLGQHPCALIGQLGHHGGRGKGGLGAALTQSRASIEAAVAPALGISTSTLDADLASGQTVAQIVAAQHADASKVQSAYLGAVQAALNQAVSSKTITSDQSSRIYTMVQTAVKNGHYPLLEKHAHG